MDVCILLSLIADYSTCTSPPAPPAAAAPPAQWIASSHPNWNNQLPPGWQPPLPPNPPQPPPPPPAPAAPAAGSPAATAIFDGKDRLELKDDWFLIRGPDSAFFLEHATTSLDPPGSQLSTSLLNIDSNFKPCRQ